MDWFNNISPVWQALIATTFTWGITALGALTVCFFKDLNKKVLNTILGFSAGVMIAASVWSLIIPAVEMAEGQGIPSWIPAAVGVISGVVFLLVINKVAAKYETKENGKKLNMLLLSVTLHNIPEGLVQSRVYENA